MIDILLRKSKVPHILFGSFCRVNMSNLTVTYILQVNTQHVQPNLELLLSLLIYNKKRAEHLCARQYTIFFKKKIY